MALVIQLKRGIPREIAPGVFMTLVASAKQRSSIAIDDRRGSKALVDPRKQ